MMAPPRRKRTTPAKSRMRERGIEVKTPVSIAVRGGHRRTSHQIDNRQVAGANPRILGQGREPHTGQTRPHTGRDGNENCVLGKVFYAYHHVSVPRRGAGERTT